MSHLAPVANAWRAVRLVIRPAEGGPSASWGLTAGRFADENADKIPTATVRALAEGRSPELTIGGGGTPAFVVSCGDEIGMTPVGQSAAAEVAEPRASLSPATIAAALAQAEQLRDASAERFAEAKEELEWAIETLAKRHAAVRSAQVEFTGREVLVTALRAAAPVEA